MQASSSVVTSFTPDNELDLLFPPEYISQEVRDLLPQDLHVRTT